MTDFAALISTVQELPETVSHPLQPVKMFKSAGVAVSVTTVSLSKGAEQVEPQLIPLGAEVTVPLPMPDLSTVRKKRSRVKTGVTDRDPFMVTLQISTLVESHPLQLSNVDPATGDAVRVNAVPVL